MAAWPVAAGLDFGEVIHRPADDALVEHVDDGSEIEPAKLGSVLREGGDRDTIGRAARELADAWSWWCSGKDPTVTLRA